MNHEEICQAVLTTPALSAAAYARLGTLSGIDWANVFDLVKKYGPVAISALEQVLPLVVPGSAWVDVVVKVVDIIAQKFGPVGT
jgi:hypothetical protein